MQENLVEVFFVTDPSRKRMVTRDAAEYMKPKWQRTDGVNMDPKKKDVVPVEASATNFANAALDKLREEYKKLSGIDADPNWNHARVHIEMKKIEAGLINEVAAPTVEEVAKVTPPPVLETPVYEAPKLTEPIAGTETAEKPKRKYTKKAKEEATA